MSILGEKSIFSFLQSPSGAVMAAVICIVVLSIVLLITITGLNVYQLGIRMIKIVFKAASKFINKRETAYKRDLEIGKIDEKRRKVKIYRFLNDLTIDLGLKQQGATPYEFLFIVTLVSVIITVVMCELLFGSLFMVMFMLPIIMAAIVCTLYTKANIAHDKRIESIIEAENIICNNISGGVLVAVKGTLNVLPKEVREEFRDFIDNVESKNFHIRIALLELNNHLGSVADDFIKKCINFETEEEHGIVGIFRDVVEINNIKMANRLTMKHKFEEVTQSFIIGAAMIFCFLGGVIALYDDIAHFYFKTPLGQIIIALDALLLIIEFVYITYLRASDL